MNKDLYYLKTPINDLKDNYKEIVITFIISIFLIFLPLFVPIIMGKIIDYGILQNNKTILIKYSLISLIISLIMVGLNYSNDIINKKIETNYTDKLRKRIVAFIQNQDWKFIDTIDEGKLINIYMNEIELISFFYTSNATLLLNDIVTSVFSITVLIKINSKLFWIITLLQIFIMFIQSRMNWIIERNVDKVNKKNDDLNSNLQEIIVNIIYLIKSNFYGFKTSQLNYASEDALIENFNLKKIEGLNRALVNFLKSIIVASMYYYCGTEIINGSMSFGELTIFSMYSTRYISPISRLMELKVTIIRVIESIKRVYSYADSPCSINTCFSMKNIEVNLKKDIIFNNVNFYYGNNIVLNKFNFAFKGQKINLLKGRSGLGKSTITALIQKYIVPSKGEIYIGNKNISEIDAKNLRDNISYVSQDSNIFEDSLRNNITMGIKTDDKNILRAINYMNLTELLAEFNYNLDYNISANKVSKGQAQRISLCRAYIQNRDIVILDEAMSNLDYDNELKILNVLKEKFKDKTIIIISHSNIYLDFCDNICDLDLLEKHNN